MKLLIKAKLMKHHQEGRLKWVKKCHALDKEWIHVIF